MIQPYLKSAGKIKKVKTSTLRNRADRLYREWGRLTYDKCLICGGEYSCLHHYHPKSTSTALRYDTDNGIPISAGCHLKLHAGNPDIQNTINMKMGLEWVEEMELRKYTIKVKPDNQWYLANIERLEGMINAIK